MTTPYSVTTAKGSVTYNSYVNAPITGPLSTNQTPCHIPYHSYGTLRGIRPTPPQFYPSQEPVNASMNTNARHHYLRTSITPQAYKLQRQRAIATSGNSFFSYNSGRTYPTTGHMNYINPIPSSMYVDIKKKNAVGQSGYKVNLAPNVPTSTKNYYPSGVRSSLRRARSGGCTAPKKKGAIANTSLANPRICAWGSLPRQNY